MSDPSHQRDELVSVYIDGEATPAERVRVEADPELVRRVGELRAVRAALAAPVAPPDAPTRDAAIAAARAARATATTVPAGPTVTAIDRRRPNRRALAVMGAAAVAAIAIVAVVATRPSHEGTSTSASASTQRPVAGPSSAFQPETKSAGAPSTAAAATAGAVPSTTVAAAGSPARGASAASDTAGAAPPYLGVADDDSELRALLGANQVSAVTTPPAPLATNGCAVPAATLVGTVTWQGTTALVFVANGLATVVDVSDCRPITTVPLT